MSWPRAALAALLLVLALPLAAAGPLQDRVDAAPAGTTLDLEAGVFAGPLRITGALTLRGAAIGESLVTSETAPVVDIAGSPVVLDRIALKGPEPMLRARGDVAVMVRDLTGAVTFAAEAGARVTIEVPAGAVAPRVLLEDARATYGHPVDVRATYADGPPLRDAPVQLWDGPALVWEGRLDSEGRAGRVFVPDRWEAHDAAAGTTSGLAAPRLVFPGAGGHERALAPGESEVAVVTHVSSPAVQTGLGALPFAIAAGLAGLGAAIALRFDRVRWPWLLLLAPLYTRLARKEILEHGTREALYGYLEAHPGASLRQLGREVGLRQGTLLHHLGVLERERYIRSVRDGQYRRFYVAGALPAAASDPLAERVLHLVLQRPGISNQALAAALDKRPSLVHYHVERLAEAGRVRKERDGRVVRLYPARGAMPATALPEQVPPTALPEGPRREPAAPVTPSPAPSPSPSRATASPK